jgi:hypothetical protein
MLCVRARYQMIQTSDSYCSIGVAHTNFRHSIVPPRGSGPSCTISRALRTAKLREEIRRRIVPKNAPCVEIRIVDAECHSVSVSLAGPGRRSLSRKCRSLAFDNHAAGSVRFGAVGCLDERRRCKVTSRDVRNCTTSFPKMASRVQSKATRTFFCKPGSLYR